MARKLLILPLSSFNRLADELGDPEVDVSLVHMTSRCGSTLISQMMNRVPNTRSMSEPWATVRLAERYNRGCYRWADYRRLVRSAMRLHCKVEPGTGIRRIVLKMAPMASVQVEMLAEMFPDFAIVFNTRHPAAAIPSLLKVLGAVKGSLYARTGLWWPCCLAYLLTYPYKERYLRISSGLTGRWVRPVSYEECFAIGYASFFASFLEAKRVYRRVVVYEDLVADPDGEVDGIFRAVRAPVEHKAEAMRALRRDSQDGRFGGRGEAVRLDDDTWRKVEAVFDRFHTGLRRDMSMAEFKELLRLPNN